MRTPAPACFVACFLTSVADAQPAQNFTAIPDGVRESSVPGFPGVRDRDLMYRPEVDRAYARDLLFRPEIDASRVLRVEPRHEYVSVVSRFNQTPILGSLRWGGFDPQTGNFDRPLFVLDSPDESGNTIDK